MYLGVLKKENGKLINTKYSYKPTKTVINRVTNENFTSAKKVAKSLGRVRRKAKLQKKLQQGYMDEEITLN